MTLDNPLIKKKPVRVWLLFMVQISLVMALFIFGLYMGVYMRDKDLIQQQILTSARAHFHDILITRMWNAAHGGVYVEKRPGVEPNPYLEDQEIVTSDGRVFLKRNPAIMTREISQLASDQDSFRYNITSLNPLNPNNKPDAFEISALKQFETGATEVFIEEPRGDSTFFRFMAPLRTTKDCLPCHAKQGYQVGQVRGGISVAVNITPVKKALDRNRLIILGLILISAAAVIAIFCFFTLRLMRQLQAAQDKIAKLAVTDELTGLANRRYFFQRFDEEIDRARRYGSGLALIMLDIDHFKHVNDTYGHPMGDKVLKEVARLLQANVRASDITARYGGEEFAILIPAMNAAEAKQAAEKLRNVIEVNDMVMDGPELCITVSAGVADIEVIRNKGGNMKDRLIRNADRALYTAKADGRNRVELYQPRTEKQLPLV